MFTFSAEGCSRICAPEALLLAADLLDAKGMVLKFAD
jgi:hypothetical protein